METSIVPNRRPPEEATAGTESGLLHVITGLGRGGAERSLVQLLRALRAFQGSQGWRTCVLSLTAGGSEAGALRELGVRVVELDLAPGPGLVWKTLRQLGGTIRSFRPTIIHGWMYHGNVAAWLGRLLGARSSPLAWNIRRSPADFADVSRLTRLVLRFERLLSGRPDMVVFNSHVGARLHTERGYRPRASKIIPNGCDTRLFCPSSTARVRIREELGIATHAKLIGHVARLHPDKDHQTAFGAAARVLRQHPDVHFVFVGNDVTRQVASLADMAAHAGPEERIHLIGERPDMPSLLPAFDVLCSSSKAEGFPNVLVEAMSCGVPCVTTAAGDSALIVGDSERVVPIRDPDALATGLERLLEIGSARRAELGASCRVRVQQEFNISTMRDSYFNLYSELENVRHRRFGPPRPGTC